MPPMQSKFRQVLGIVKDQTSISLAKVAGTAHADLDVVLVKATSHDEIPIDEKYVQEIILMISNSHSAMLACITGLAKRLHKTHDWIVALKCLVLLHQLLCAGDDKFEDDMALTSRRGLAFLDISGFTDEAHTNSWDFSSFVRSYASFLAQRLDFFVDVGSHGGSTRGRELRTELYLDRLPKLQNLLDRAITCRPTGAARNNRLVQIALSPVVRESFQLYFEICNGITVLLDGFFETEHSESLTALGIYSKAAEQADDLVSFYDTCKNMGVCAPHEYPEVQRIPKEHLETMEDFVREQSNMSSLTSGVLALPAPDSRFDEPDRIPYKEQIVDRSHRRGLPAVTVSPKKHTPTNIQPKIEPPQMQDTLAPPSPKKAATILTPIPQQHDAELLNLDKGPISHEEHDQQMALALFPPSSGTTVSNNWEIFTQDGEDDKAIGSGRSGWELALVSSDPPVKVTSSAGISMAGNFDNFLLDSLYEQGEARQKQAHRTAAGSASSVALPSNRPASLFLALPGPSLTANSEDPFAASVTILPPAYVQMADMRQKQLSFLEEQRIWQHYQTSGLQCPYTFENPSHSIYNGVLATPIQPLSYQYMGALSSYTPNNHPSYFS